MSHKIAQARKLGLTGRAADRFGHGGFQSQTATGQVVGTPPSARKTFRKFETPKTKDKTDSFLNVTKQRNVETVFKQSVLKSTLDARRINAKERREQFSRDLVESLSLNEVKSVDRLLPPTRTDVQEETKLIGQKALLESRSILQQQENDREKMLRAGITIRPPLPTSLVGRDEFDIKDIKRKKVKEGHLQKIRDEEQEVIDRRINLQIEAIPSDIRDVVKVEVDRRRLLGEEVSEFEVDRITFKSIAENQQVFDKVLDILVPDIGDGISNVNRFIAEEAFYGDERTIDLATPDRESVALIFERAGIYARERNITIEEAFEQARIDVLPALKDLEDEELNRQFGILLEEGRREWKDKEERLATELRVWQKWLPKLGVDLETYDFDSLSVEDMVKLDKELLQGEKTTYLGGPFTPKRRFTVEDTRSLIRILDTVDPDAIPDSEIEEFFKELKNAVHEEEVLNVLGLEIDEMTLVMAPLFPVFTGGMLLLGEVGKEVGKPIGGQIAVALGKDKERGEQVGSQVFELAFGMVGGGVTHAQANRLKVLARRTFLGYGQPVFFPKLTEEVLSSRINVYKPLYESRLAEMTGEKIVNIQLRHVKAVEYGVKSGESRGKILKDLTERGLTTKQAKESYKLFENVTSRQELAARRLRGIEDLAYFEAEGRPINVVKEEVEAAASTLQTRARAGEDALSIFDKLSSAKDNLVRKAGAAALRAITGESQLVRDVRKGATRFTINDQKALDRLTRLEPSLSKVGQKELNRLVELQKLGGGKSKSVINRINELRSIKNKTGRPQSLTKAQEKLLKELKTKKLQTAGSEANLAATKGFVEKAFSAQAKQVILDLAKGTRVTRDRLIRAAKNEGVFVEGTSNLELQNRIFIAAKESGKETGRFAGVGAEKSVESTAKTIETFNTRLRNAEAQMQSFKESPQGIRLDAAISKYREILTKKRNWGDVASDISKEAEIAAETLEGLPGFSLPELVKGARATNTASPLGWALSGKGLAKRITRSIMGNSIFLESEEQTGRIIGAGYGREMLVDELSTSRFRVWKHSMEALYKETGLTGKEAERYIGEDLAKGFDHNFSTMMVRPNSYNLTKSERAVIDIMRESVTEQFAYTERLMGVDTQLFQDILARQAQGMEGIAEGFSMVDDLGYWAQYLDPKSFEQVTGKSLKGLSFGSDGRRAAWLGKDRIYKDVFELWKAVGTGKRPIKLLDPWDSMARRASASGHAIADAQYKQSMIRTFNPKTTKTNTFSASADGFQGKFFKPDVAEALNVQNRVLSGHIPNRKLRIAANIIRSFKLSGDLSGAIGIQGMFFLSTVINRPMFMATHAIPAAKMLLSPKYFEKWYAMNYPEIIRLQSAGLKVATNPVDIARITKGSLGFKNLHTIPGRVMDTLNDANFGRMVTFYKIETAKQYLEIMRYAKASPEFAGFAEKIPGIRKMLGSLKGVKGVPDEKIEQIVMEAVNRRFGGLSQALMGKDANRIFLEQMLDIAPNWLRARVSLYIDAFGPQKGRISKKTFGPERYLALNMIGRELATAATISTAVSYGLTGELPNLTRPDKFDWLGIKTPIGVIPTIPSVAIMRFFARESKTIFDTVHAVAKGENVGDVLWNTTLTETQTNFGRILKGRESPALGLLLEQLTGENFYGEDITSWDRRVRSLALGILPIFVEDTVEASERTGAFSLDPRNPKLDVDKFREVAAITGVAIGGGSIFPPSPWRVLKEMQDETSKDLFGRLKNPEGELVYGPEVVFEDLSIPEQIQVNNQARIIKQQDIADVKGKELGFDSIWLTEEYEEDRKELSETGTMNGEVYWSEDLTQAKINKMILNGEITDAAYRNMTWNIRKQTSTALKTLRGKQDRPEFEEEDATNAVDKEIDTYFDISLEDFGLDEEGEPNFDKYGDALDAQFDKVVALATAHAGKSSGDRVSNFLRPEPEDLAGRQFRDAAELKDNLEELPKYRFLTVEQSALTDRYIDMATALSRMDRDVGGNATRKDFLEFFIGAEGFDNDAAIVALFRQVPELREQMWNPARAELIFEKPYTVRYYVSFYENMSENNKIKFRSKWRDQFFSDFWLDAEAKELDTPEVFQGLDLGF